MSRDDRTRKNISKLVPSKDLKQVCSSTFKDEKNPGSRGKKPIFKTKTFVLRFNKVGNRLKL